jgi:hypothetical protein
MTRKNIWQGSFEVKNNLLYYLPVKDDGLNIDHNLKVEGKWDITKNGSLRFLVGHSQNKLFGKTITIGTELAYIKVGSLEFKAAKRVLGGKNIKAITLSGDLVALSNKKIAFVFEHEGEDCVLKLSGTWDVFKGNQIGCMVKRTLEGKQITDLLILKGDWDIAGNTVTYEVDKSSKPFLSREFTIKRAIFTQEEHGLEFVLGMGAKSTTNRYRTSEVVSLNGTWKQDGTRAEFIFNSSQRQTFAFTLSRKFSSDRELTFELETGQGKKPSFALTFTKKIKGDSSFFVKGEVCGREKRVEVGFYFPF